jgi:hypothetical protein
MIRRGVFCSSDERRNAMTEKPALGEFMIRNVPLAAALDALKRWDDLTDKERQRLGFAPATSELGFVEPVGNSL